MSVYKRMKEITEGLAVSKVATLLNEKESRVRAVLYGKQKVPEDFLVKFIQVFDVDANWLLLGIGEKPELDLNSRERALIANYRASPEEARRSVETTAALLAKHETKTLKKSG